MTTIIFWEDDVDMMHWENGNYNKNGMDSWYLSSDNAYNNLGNITLHLGTLTACGLGKQEKADFSPCMATFAGIFSKKPNTPCLKPHAR